MFTVAALTLWIVVGAANGEYIGSKVFEDRESCEQVRSILQRNYKDLSISKCIEVPVFGTGVSPETNEAP